MNFRNVCIIGGTGFIGRHIAQRLVGRGCRVTIPTRNRERAKQDLLVLPTAEVVNADIHDDAALAGLLAGQDAVINLVGILAERRSGDFARAHALLPQRIAAACRAAGVKRLLHMSALQAGAEAPSRYLRTKGEGEAAVRAADGLDWTIFRPAVVFGREDTFLNLFARLQAVLPVILLGSPNARFQPVFVEDVAEAFAASLGNRETFGRSYDLCGPDVYTLRELVAFAGRMTGYRRPIIGLGSGLSFLQALVLEYLPGRLLTRDNLASMEVDNVCGCPFPAVFGITPAALEAAAPAWLSTSVPRGRYQTFRSRARRR